MVYTGLESQKACRQPDPPNNKHKYPQTKTKNKNQCNTTNYLNLKLKHLISINTFQQNTYQSPPTYF